MSCQQLIQEDPYVFTDNISNSASFMPQNNSQTKYVPLSRQTIYSRQFRQHEPSIAAFENVSINGLLHHQQKSPSPNRNVVISKSSVNHKKNGLTNGLVSKATKSPRTSPKFFKSHQLQPASFKVPDGQYLVNNSTHHSTTVSSQPVPSNHQQQQEVQQGFSTQLDHVAAACENGIINNITGIKQGLLSGKSHAIMSRGKVEKLKVGAGGRLQSKIRTNSKNLSKPEKFSTMRHLAKPQATKSQNVTVEPVSLSSLLAPEVQSRHRLDLDVTIFHVTPLSPLHHLESDIVQTLSRDDRIIQRKVQLRHRVDQFKGAQRYRTTERSKLRFNSTLKLLNHLDRAKEQIFKRTFKPCQYEDCPKEAIFHSHHCAEHILWYGKEQHLFRQCCFQYSPSEQCSVPVHDVMATIPACYEHQNAPAHQLIDPAKPKKPNQISRKRTNKAPLIRPVKKNGKNGKKKLPIVKPAAVPGHRPTMIIHPNDINKPMKMSVQQQKPEIVPENHQFIHHNSGNLLASSQSSYGSITSASDDLYLKQDLMTICENSYESSEDTGVGGLSENELMPHEMIGPFDMESCAELTKVLSSLPTNTLDDLLTEPLQTSRDDEEYLDRAIEEVSSVGMDQIAITAFDHLDGLGDMLEMMDDEEQRQMISAATNLISMSGMQGFLSNHDQDYSAMPSPMMS